MKPQRANWKYTTPQIRTLVLAGASILALVSVAAARNLDLDVSGVKQGDSVIVAHAEANTTHAADRCKVSGCSREECADHDVITPCIWKPEYACYKKAVCEVQSDGKCGWTMTGELKTCLRNSPTGKVEPPPN